MIDKYQFLPLSQNINEKYKKERTMFLDGSNIEERFFVCQVSECTIVLYVYIS